MKNNTLLQTFYLNRFIVTIVLLVFLLQTHTVIAQTIPMVDDNNTVTVAYPNGTNNPAWDAVIDYTIPSSMDGKDILFTLEGGDGDKGSDSNTTINAAEGATVMFRVSIGSAANEVPAGSVIRFIIGQGNKDECGGGGTGVAFRRPVAVPGLPRWVILGVAGGGGGSENFDDGGRSEGRPGRANPSGYWGRGLSNNANNGHNGEDGADYHDSFGHNDDDWGHPGKGYLSSMTVNSLGNDEPVGSFGPGSGTWGFGGGGGSEGNFTSDAAGGGGGYSGGGGGGLTTGSSDGGGGGGSWVNSTYAEWQSIIENGHTTSPGHGFGQFEVRCSTELPNAEITDIITLNTNDCDAASDFVWLNVVADPLLGSACGARLVTRDNEAGVWDLSIPYSDENTTTAAAANAYIEKDVEYNIVLSEPSSVVSHDGVITNRVIVFPKFQWQNEAEFTLTSSNVTLTAQDLVTMTGTSSTLIQGFSFQFLNANGTIAEGEDKTFSEGSYSQKIGLVSFAGTITCQYEMTINVKAPEIEVNDCLSSGTELIENIQPVWYRINGHNTQWQSFSPESSGIMQDLFFEIVPDTFNGFEIPQNATLTIHRGEGADGQVLYTKSLAGALSTFNTITIDEDLYLQEDEVYTFAITDPTTTNWGLAFYITDNYTRGRHFIWNDRDVSFRINLSETCDEDSGIVSTYIEDTTIGATNSKTFTISNTGSDILSISNITSSNSQFTIGTYNTTITPGASTTFTVSFTPTTAGDQNATITINSNATNEPAYNFNIKGEGVTPLQLTCKDNLVFTLDSNGQLSLNFDDIVDTVEGPYSSSSINGSNTIQFNGCNDIGDQPITLEISTDGGTPISCSTTVRVNPQVTYPTIGDVTLYFNRGGARPTYDYDVSAFATNCASFSQPTLVAGLPSGAQFPGGTTTNTFEITNNDISFTYSFNVTVVENPVETLITLENGQIAISDWNTITDDDQITLSTSDDGNTLYIGNLNGSVQLIGSALSYEGDTGKVVAVPMSDVTNGIIFHARQGNDGVTFTSDFTLTGANNTLRFNDISNYQQLGALTVEGDVTINGDADIVITDGTFDGIVTLRGNTIDIRAINEDLTLGNITATGTAATDMNYIYSEHDIWFGTTVQTAGDSNLTIRGELVQQSTNGTITTNELILECNTSGVGGFVFDTTVNNINKLTSNTTNHLTGGILFKDLDTVELGAINTGLIYFTANTYTFTEDTNLTFNSNSFLTGGINITATNSSSPAQINHNGGTLIMNGANPYSFTGAFQYTAVAGSTTDIRNAEVLIDTPDHIQTFGTLEKYFDPFIVAAGSTVNFLDKGDFSLGGTSLEGTGIINGDVDIRNAGTLNPGTDAGTGTLTINGNLKLFKNANSSDNEGNFAPLLNSDTDYDAVDVFGTVELIDADFEPTGSFIDSETNQEIILINNDGTDAVIGTFSDLPEGTGYTYGEFLGIISYVGGDGNDVSLIKQPINSFITTWKTDNPGTSDDNTITIPTASGETYNYTIDWGDGTVETITTSTPPSHTYATPGTVTVIITGTFPRIVFDFNNGDRQKITQVTQWGNIQWSSMESAFAGCTNLDVTATDTPDLSNIITMATMFSNCTNLVGNPTISTWDVSNVTTLAATFSGTDNFNQNLSNWDTSNVTNMGFMFTNATGITQDFIQTTGGWNTSNVTDMNSMFSGAINFNGDVSTWDTSSVTVMGFLFDNTALNQDLSNWNTGNVVKMEGVFKDATDFNSDISGWDTSEATDMDRMFENATSFNQNLADWDISSLGDAPDMFLGSGLSNENYDNLLIGWSIDTSGNPNDGIDDVPSTVDFGAGSSQYCVAETEREDLITNGWTITDGGKACPKFQIKVYLQGASLDVSSGGLFEMRDDLRVNNLIPTTSPYDGITTFDPAILTNDDEEAIVDWIWVELRDANDNTITVFSDSFLIRKDGFITSTTEGILEANVREGNYYVVVKHRNHLGIMSASPITLNTVSFTNIDFTDGTVPTYGANAQTTFGMPAGMYGMWTGNVNDDGIIQYSGTNPDSPAILSEVLNDAGNFLNFPTFTVSGYKKYDINMDGSTQYSGTNPDTPIILQNVLAHPGNFLNFSTYQIREQLPENQ